MQSSQAGKDPNNEKKVGFFQKRVINPIKDVISSGITPHKLALSVAAGICGGIFPIPGTTTLICLFFVFVLKVNVVIVQVINLCLTPVDIALIPVHMYLASLIFRYEDLANFSMESFMKEMGENMMGALLKFQTSLAFAILAWAIILVPLFVVIYLICFPIFQRILPNLKSN